MNTINPRRRCGIDLAVINAALIGPWQAGDVLDALTFSIQNGNANGGSISFDLIATREPHLASSAAADGGHWLTDRPAGGGGIKVGFEGDGVGASSGTQRVPICYYFDGQLRFLWFQWSAGSFGTVQGASLFLEWHPGEIRPVIGDD